MWVCYGNFWLVIQTQALSIIYSTGLRTDLISGIGVTLHQGSLVICYLLDRIFCQLLRLLGKSWMRGHTSGPFTGPPFPQFHCSPLGAVPKKDGTHRIILDLSSPRGSAINEGIPVELFSVKYSSFDDAVEFVRSLGQCYMAKLDIKHAFRLCPVQQEQWPLLGYQWVGHYFVDTRLPFGSRSSPFIFNQFAEALLWILVQVTGIAFVVHYLDNFFLCNSSFEDCEHDMEQVKHIFSELGVPLAPEKIIGPSTVITYLGIEIDSTSQVLRLPPDKLAELNSLLHVWSGRKKCTKREVVVIDWVLVICM